MKKYNVGIIGYGWVATAHIQAINATTNAQVRAIYSSTGVFVLPPRYSDFGEGERFPTTKVHPLTALTALTKPNWQDQ